MVFEGNANELQSCLKKPKKPLRYDDVNASPLHYAAEEGDIGLMEMIINDSSCEGNTMLQCLLPIHYPIRLIEKSAEKLLWRCIGLKGLTSSLSVTFPIGQWSSIFPTETQPRTVQRPETAWQALQIFLIGHKSLYILYVSFYTISIAVIRHLNCSPVNKIDTLRRGNIFPQPRFIHQPCFKNSTVVKGGGCQRDVSSEVEG